jgi:hypothetical protein
MAVRTAPQFGVGLGSVPYADGVISHSPAAVLIFKGRLVGME